MKTLMIIAVALAGLSPDAATAQPANGDVVREAVRHDDLDLAKPGDVRRLDSRVRIAVRRLCGDASDVDVAGKEDVRRCRSAVHLSLADRRRDLILAARRADGRALSAR